MDIIVTALSVVFSGVVATMITIFIKSFLVSELQSVKYLKQQFLTDFSFAKKKMLSRLTQSM